jgi:hypothetical protein
MNREEEGREERRGGKEGHNRRGLWKEKTGWRRFGSEITVHVFLFPLWCVWIVWRGWQWGKAWGKAWVKIIWRNIIE